MKVTITTPIVHLCPHVDEVDVGTLTVVFDGEAPELHAVRAVLASFHDRRITHEALVGDIAARYPGAQVSGTFRTAGFDVLVEACSTP